MSPKRKKLVTVIWGMAGGAVGYLAVAPEVQADCAGPEWRVMLESVTSEDATSSQKAFWPAEGLLTSYPGHARIRGFVEPQGGSVATVEAEQ